MYFELIYETLNVYLYYMHKTENINKKHRILCCKMKVLKNVFN